MCDDDDFDDCDFGDGVSDEDGDDEAVDLDQPEPALPDFEGVDPEDEDEAEPAPGDFWFESDDSGDE